jgi:hypothetical protein
LAEVTFVLFCSLFVSCGNSKPWMPSVANNIWVSEQKCLTWHWPLWAWWPDEFVKKSPKM